MTVKAYSEDEAAVEAVKELLTWEYIANGNSAKNKIMADLSLPTEIEGHAGVKISWSSNKPAAVPPEGKVSRPQSGGNVSGITLTATITKNGATVAAAISGLTVLAVTSYDKNLDKDVDWLMNTWAADKNLDSLTADLELPAKGGAGKTSIKWATSDQTLITATGTVNRPAAGSGKKQAKLTATLTSSTYSRTVKFEVTVLPWDEESQRRRDEAVNAFKALFDGVVFPKTVDASNQQDATLLVRPLRARVQSAYQAARAAGAAASELDSVEGYIAFRNVEDSLQKLSKTVTVVFVDVSRNEDGTCTSGGYRLPKSKAVIPGSAKNDVQAAVNGINNACGDKLFEGKTPKPTAAFFIYESGRQIKADGNSNWFYAVNGERQGVFSWSGTAVQRLDHGDTVTIYYAPEEETRFLEGAYAQGLPADSPVDYDFANAEVFDANWLSEGLILGDNPSRFAVTDKLNLPEKGKSGSTIKWASDNTVVVAVDGTVARPASTQGDVTVTLTATIGTLSAKKQTRTFTVTVKAIEMSVTEKTLAYASQQLELPGLDAVTADLTLSAKGILGVGIAWSSSDPACIANTGAVARPEEDRDVTLTATLSYRAETTQKVFTAHVLKRADSDAEKLAYDKSTLTFDAIKGSNTAQGDVRYPLTLPAVGPMGSTIGWTCTDNVIASDGMLNRTGAARPVVLTALGYDVTNITMPDGGMLNLIEAICKTDFDVVGINALVFALLAIDSGSYDAREARGMIVEKLVEVQNADGGWPIYAGGDTDLDMTAMALAALAPYAEDPGARAALEKGSAPMEENRDALTGTPSVNGGNSNTTAMAMIAYASAPSFTNGTTMDYFGSGGLSHYVTENWRFGYLDDSAANDMATEQGVRACIAYDRFRDNNNAPVHLYRFGKPSRALVLDLVEKPTITTDLANRETDRATIEFHVHASMADGSAATVEVMANGRAVSSQNGVYAVGLEMGINEIVIQAVGANGGKTVQTFTVIRTTADAPTISVGFSLTGARHSIAPRQVAVPRGSTVKYVTELELIRANLTYVTTGAYISMIDGLAEFDHGPYSGWMYRVNGALPGVGYADKVLADGDVVEWFYSDDYREEPQDAQGNLDAVLAMIDSLPTAGQITLDDAGAVSAAQRAYNNLGSSDKAKVPAESRQKLESAVKRIAELGKLHAPSYEDAYRATGDYLSGAVAHNGVQVGSVGGDWVALGLARCGRLSEAQKQAYYNNVADFVVRNINGNGHIHKARSTEGSRVVLALTAAGYDPSDVAGHNLLAGLSDMDYVTYQGINGPIWALIAFDSHGYEIPRVHAGGVQVTREGLIDYILGARTGDGGWALAGVSADPDITAMALQALAPYYNSNAKVRAAVDRALAALSGLQLADGGYAASSGGANSESCAQVIVALTSLGADPASDSRFVKNGFSVVDALLAHYGQGGGFRHVAGGEIDGMATGQAFAALIAHARFIEGKSRLYDMRDIELKPGGNPDGSGGNGRSDASVPDSATSILGGTTLMLDGANVNTVKASLVDAGDAPWRPTLVAGPNAVASSGVPWVWVVVGSLALAVFLGVLSYLIATRRRRKHAGA